jgi:hypothetical protein
MAYDAEGWLQTVSSSTGESLTFYEDPNDSDALVDSVTDHTGRAWKYFYDVNQNLEYVYYPDGTPGTDADNPVRQYHYEDTQYPHALTGITDERGMRYATFGYFYSTTYVLNNGVANMSYLGSSANPVETVQVNYHNDNYNDGTAIRTVINSKGEQTVYTTIEQNGVALLANISGPGCSSCTNGDTSFTYDPLTNDRLTRTEGGYHHEIRQLRQ